MIKSNAHKAMPFVATHSVLEAFDNCPRKFAASYVFKEVDYKPSAPADLGVCLHKLAEWYTQFNTSGNCPVMEDILTSGLTTKTYDMVLNFVAPKFTPSYVELKSHWANIVPMLEKLPWGTPGVKVLFEFKCAANKDGTASNYYEKTAAFRAIIDLLVICGPVAMIIDFKTGKELKPSKQLERASVCVFASFPGVKVAHTAFVSSRGHPSLKDGVARESSPEIMQDILNSVDIINRAYATETWTPKPSGLCRDWCPVRNCAHFGGGAKCL